MKVILAGGGTLGSVSPLIAIYQKLKKQNNSLEFLFVGTKNGPEGEFVGRYDLPYRFIAGGKFRRYFSLWNLVDIFNVKLGFIQSFFILKRFKPDVIISAGSFVAVPLIWASALFKIKVILYQPDLKVGLSNKLCQKFAFRIFTAFPETVKDFPADKAEYLGSLLRQEIAQVLPFATNNQQPIILVLGGGTGSAFINQFIFQLLPELTGKYRVIHVTGHNKNTETRNPKPETNTNVQNLNYQKFELLRNNYYQTIADADLVISRAGVSTLMELSYFGKPVILIPLPDSAQEQNAEYFCVKNAAVCLIQNGLTSEKLIGAVDNLRGDRDLTEQLSQNIHQIFEHNNYQIIEVILK